MKIKGRSDPWFEVGQDGGKGIKRARRVRVIQSFVSSIRG